MPKANRILLFIALISLTLSVSIQLLSTNFKKENLVRLISEKIQFQLEEVENESKRILSDSTEWEKVEHSFFLLDGVEIKYWNKNDFLPDIRLLQEPFDIQFIQTQRGDYILKKTRSGSNFYLIGVIPLVEEYKVSNTFLKAKWNEKIFPIEGIQISDSGSSSGSAITFHETELFKVLLPDTISLTTRNKSLAIFFWFFGLTALLLFLFRLIYFLYINKKELLGFVMLSTSLICLRLINIYGDIPNFFSGHDFFDPRLFASSSLNPSLGDLLLNTLVVLIVSIYVFLTYHRWEIVSQIISAQGLKRNVLKGLLLVFGFFSFLFPFFYFEIIFHNSALSLDLTQSIQFDSIRFIAFFCVAMATICSFCFCHVFFQLYLSLSKRNLNAFLFQLLIAAAIFILYFLIIGRDYWITLLCGTIYFSVIYFFKLSGSLKHISYITFFYLLVSVFLYAIQGSLSIKRFSVEERVSSQFRFANEFLTGRDVLGEYLLNESVGQIKSDPFIQNRMANPFLSKSSIRQKVRQIYLNNYFDRYDIGIYLYNSVGDPLDAEPYLDFATQVKAYQIKSSTTGYDGIFFTSDGRNEADRRYLTIVPIERAGIPSGFVVIELTMKKLVPRNVYPELLIDNRFAVYLQSRNFSYAIFAKNKITSTFGEFNYERNLKFSDLANSELYSKGALLNGFVHVAVEDEDQRVAIVSAGKYPLFYLVANFSFWVVISIFLVLILLAIQGFYLWLKGERINYSSRVQLYFYSSLFVPLLVVGITTLSVTTRSAANELNQEFINKSKLVRESLTSDLVAFTEDKSISKVELEKKIIDVAHVSDVDATVYDAHGKLIGSSQPLIYDYQFKSQLIDREAWDRVVKEKEIAFVKQDRIGTLNYFSAYSALRSPRTGKLIGFVTLPFFGSASSLERTQIIILANILSIFMVVLLVFSVFSLYAADQLTFPLRKIARSLGRTTLTGHNEKLEWNSSDEIGVMVKEYNRMVQNLDQSKVELARSQKESAWREMAKQVAHEIKNPLTPMKLSLQQMEQVLRRGEGLSSEKVERSIKTMLTQVEILNEIASSFSTFARMPSPVLVKVDLNSLVKQSVDLYSDQEKGRVSSLLSGRPVFVLGDEKLLVRVFSNLILNALQSGNGSHEIHVEVSLVSDSNQATVTIKDNGMGISEELKDKIFAPYFSTKKSGSGLGLAIVKQGIEQSGGKIELVSVEGKGTTFIVQLPIIN